MPPKKKEEEDQEKFKRVITNLEKGDCRFQIIFQSAICILGKTKIGKTSFGHYLCNKTLKPIMKQGRTHYTPATEQFKNNIIGLSSNSQTQIPNVFKTEANGKQIILIDCPGYQDSYGCHRLISNSFFHYRVFSKVQKIKFILAFDQISLKSTGKDLISTITQFIRGFKQFQTVIDKILPATAFVFTQTESARENIMGRLKCFTDQGDPKDKAQMNLTDRLKGLVKKIVSHMINNDKVYCFQKAKPKVNSPQNKLAAIIDDKLKCWERKQAQPPFQNQIDMTEINFAVAEKVGQELSIKSKDNLFKVQYQYLQFKMGERKDEILCFGQNSFKQILLTFIDDVYADSKSLKFKKKMELLLKKEYCFQDDKTKTQKKKPVKFGSNEKTQESPLKKTKMIPKNKNYSTDTEIWPKKFKVLDQILQIFKEAKEQKTTQSRSVLWLCKQQNRFEQIVDFLMQLKLNPIEQKEIYLKFRYLIHRMFEQAKILQMIIQNEYSVQNIQIMQLAVPIQDILKQIQDDGSFNDKKIQFCDKYSFNKYPTVNKEIVQFFDNIAAEHKDLQNIVIKAIEANYRFCTDYQVQKDTNQNKIITFKLYVCRKLLQNFLKKQQSNFNEQEHNKAIILIMDISNELGNKLVQANYSVDAIQVFDSVYNVQQVINTYNKLIGSFKEQKQIFEAKLAEYLIERGLYEKALSIYQRLMFQAKEIKTRKHAACRIQKIINRNLDSDKKTKCEQYVSNMHNGIFWKPIEQETQRNIREFLGPKNDFTSIPKF